MIYNLFGPCCFQELQRSVRLDGAARAVFQVLSRRETAGELLRLEPSLGQSLLVVIAQEGRVGATGNRFDLLDATRRRTILAGPQEGPISPT